MDIDTYKNFLAIIDAGSVTAAAERMHITQPSLSKQLRMLEAFYGGPLILLQRGRKEIILTEAGRVLYEKAKYITSSSIVNKEAARRSSGLRVQRVAQKQGKLAAINIMLS